MTGLQRRRRRRSALETRALHPTCPVPEVSPACRRAPKGALGLLEAAPAALGRQGHDAFQRLGPVTKPGGL